MHDYQQIVRLQQLNNALVDGQFPVRWVADLGFGYGYPLFNFYPPFVYYLGEVFHLLGFGFLGSIKLVWFFALFGSGVTMYFLSKEFFGRIGGIVSAMFYIYAPYHAIDAYVRGALAELFSFVWLPLILLCSYKTVKTRELKWVILSGLFLGLLMITHNLIFLPFLGLYTGWHFLLIVFDKKGDLVKQFSFYLIIVILAFGLTSFFWLPSLAEKQYTLVDQLLTTTLASYKIHYVCIEQLWNSVWGYGGSTLGCVDGISFKIGKLHIVVAVLVFILTIYLKYKGRINFLLPIAASFLLLVFCVLMTTSYSGFVWDNIPQLWYLQFPWRFLEFVALFSSIICGSVVFLIKSPLKKFVTAAVLVIILISSSQKLFTPQYFYPDANDISLTSNEEIKWNVSGTSFEYLPKGIATKLTDKNTLWIDIDKDNIQKQNYKVILGDFLVAKEDKKFLTGKFILKGESIGKSTIEFQTVNFPGWKVWINGNEVGIRDNNKYRLITVDLVDGYQEIVGEFTDTPVRKIANLLTLLTILIILCSFYAVRRSKT